MNNELNQIIATVMRHTGAHKFDILFGRTPSYRMARGYVCYLITEGFPHLRTAFQDMAEIRIDRFWAAATNIETSIKENPDVFSLVNRMRDELHLPLLRGKQVDYISPTKRMFGFDYTEAEEMQFKRLKDEADEFWARITRLGVQPHDSTGLFYTDNNIVSQSKES